MPTALLNAKARKNFWLNIGIAYKHEAGEGLNILLETMPLDGKLVLLTYKEKSEE